MNFKAHAPRLIKDKLVDFTNKAGTRTRYKHAGLDTITQKLAPALAKWGLSHSWSITQDGGSIIVTCRLAHRDGHSESVSMSGPPDDTGGKNRIQQNQSTVTMLSRHTLTAVTGLATGLEDDDGHGSERWRWA